MSAPPLIQDSGELEGLGRALSGEALVAIDTEADSLHSYRGKLCLVQLSTRTRTALVDPLALPDLSSLALVLADPAVVTVMHGADYDLRILRRDAGLEVRGVFDTMIAARLLGRERFGLAALLEEEFGVRLDKKHQRADWSRRPLSSALREYAATDTRHLPELHDRLRGELEAAGRWSWAEEEFRLIEGVRFENSGDPGDLWRRVKGASRLDRLSQSVLREVVIWREGVAEARDRPPFKILGREALLALAERQPTTSEALRQTHGIGRRWQGEEGRTLLAAIRAGLDRGPLPAAPRPTRPPRDPELEAALEKARAARARRSRETDLEVGVLLPNAVLEQILRAAREGDEPFAVEGLRDWQRALMQDDLAAVLPARRED